MSKGGKFSLGELMGAKGEDFQKNGVELSDLPDLLGEGMPKLEFHPLGRMRLQAALRQRFGDNYRNVPGISQLMTKFDQQAKIELEHHILKKKWGKK